MSKSIFISYSWDSIEHRERVKKFVDRLRESGLNVVYDGDIELGDRLPLFMENSVTDCEVVLFICTPYYKQKADSRIGGVGYENTIISAELYETQNEQKFISVPFSGSWENAIPVRAKGKLGVDLSDPFTFEENYNGLLKNIKRIV